MGSGEGYSDCHARVNGNPPHAKAPSSSNININTHSSYNGKDKGIPVGTSSLPILPQSSQPAKQKIPGFYAFCHIFSTPIWWALAAVVCEVLPTHCSIAAYINMVTAHYGRNIYAFNTLQESAGSVLSFFSTILCGHLSQPDRMGRKYVLLFLAIASAIPMVVAVTTHSANLYFLSRVLISSLGAKPLTGSFVVLSAWITDWANDSQKLFCFSLIYVAISISFSVGSIMGGILLTTFNDPVLLMHIGLVLKLFHPCVIAFFPPDFKVVSKKDIVETNGMCGASTSPEQEDKIVHTGDNQNSVTKPFIAFDRAKPLPAPILEPAQAHSVSLLSSQVPNSTPPSTCILPLSPTHYPSTILPPIEKLDWNASHNMVSVRCRIHFRDDLVNQTSNDPHPAPACAADVYVNSNAASFNQRHSKGNDPCLDETREGEGENGSNISKLPLISYSDLSGDDSSDEGERTLCSRQRKEASVLLLYSTAKQANNEHNIYAPSATPAADTYSKQLYSTYSVSTVPLANVIYNHFTTVKVCFFYLLRTFPLLLFITCFHAAFNSGMQSVSLTYAKAELKFHDYELCFLMSVVGISGFFFQTFLLPFLLTCFSPSLLLLLTSLSNLLYALFYVVGRSTLAIGCGCIFGSFATVSRGCFPALISKTNDTVKEEIEKNQGLIHGGFNSIRMISKSAGSILVALACHYYRSFPSLFRFPSVGFLLLSFMMALSVVCCSLMEINLARAPTTDEYSRRCVCYSAASKD